MKTVTIYDPLTGQLGPVLSGHPDDIPVVGQSVEGAYSADEYAFDLDARKLVKRGPRPPNLNELRQQRNELLDAYRWTVMPDSPLTEESKTEWLAWLGQLHTLLIDVVDAASVVFPPKPALEYRTS